MPKKKANNKTKRDSENQKAAQSKQNSQTEITNPFGDDELQNGDKIVIECPGATIYEPGTRNIISGVKFQSENDPAQGFQIIGSPVYAPEHKQRRLVKKEHVGSIRRRKACQDLTVRMIRPEGPDLYIPDGRNHHKTKLKSIEKSW